MRTKKYISVETDGGGYDLSISDLMAALCCIFVLLCVSLSAPLAQNTYLAHNYGIEEEKVYKDLKKELGKTLDDWGAEIVPKTLAIRFSAHDSFEGDAAALKVSKDGKLGFTDKLDIFFPAFIKILRRHEDLIDEIRIEGHTAINISENYSEDYESGMELSKARTKAVFDYCVNQGKLSNDDRDWARKHIVLSNYSNSRYIWGKLDDAERAKLLTILDEETVNLLDKELDSQDLLIQVRNIFESFENYSKVEKEAKENVFREFFDKRQEKSRRVEFRVKTHSDELMRQLQAMLGMEEEEE